MTKQELIDLIEDSGELVKEEGQLYHTKYLFDEESIDKLSDTILKYKNENLELRRFADYIKQSWQEEIKTYETLEREAPFMAREAIKSKLIGMRKMLGLLDSEIESFLEENNSDNK